MTKEIRDRIDEIIALQTQLEELESRLVGILGLLASKPQIKEKKQEKREPSGKKKRNGNPCCGSSSTWYHKKDCPNNKKNGGKSSGNDGKPTWKCTDCEIKVRGDKPESCVKCGATVFVQV